MKKTKLFIAAGSVLLALGAFITTKANKNKAFAATELYAQGLGELVSNTSGTYAHITTAANAGHTAFFVTQGNKSTYYTLLTSASSSHKWYGK